MMFNPGQFIKEMVFQKIIGPLGQHLPDRVMMKGIKGNNVVSNPGFGFWNFRMDSVISFFVSLGHIS